MMYAYSELYISNAQKNMGTMFDYAVHDMKMELTEFYRMFLNSGLAYRFGVGEPKYTVGMSGIELAREVVVHMTGKDVDIPASCPSEKSPEYWAGWALAYYEWYRNIPFEQINRCVSISEVAEMYHPYHEADIRRFVDEMDERIETAEDISRLARLRAYAGMTQKMLAERSGVSVRMIEQYEQGKKDLNRASAVTVYRLARTLRCSIEDLITTEVS